MNSFMVKTKNKQTTNSIWLLSPLAMQAIWQYSLATSLGTHLKFSRTDFVHLVVCILQNISFLHQLHNLLGTGCQLTNTHEIDILLI